MIHDFNHWWDVVLPIAAKSSVAGWQTLPAPKIRTALFPPLSDSLTSPFWKEPNFSDTMFVFFVTTSSSSLGLAIEVNESIMLSKSSILSAPTCQSKIEDEKHAYCVVTVTLQSYVFSETLKYIRQSRHLTNFNNL